MTVREGKGKREAGGFAGLLCACLAIAAYRLVFWSTNSGSFVPASDLLNFAEVAAQAAAMVALVFLDWRLGHTGRMGVALVAAASALQFAGGWLLFAPHFLEGFGFPGLAVLGAVFRGSGSAVLLLGLGRFLCSVKPEKSALAIGGGYAVFGLVSLALSHAPGDAIALASLASPFVSGLFLVLCGRNVRVAAEGRRPIETSLLRRVPLDIVSLLLLCALAGVVSDAFAPSNIVDPKVFNVVWAVIYLVVFLVYCVWVFGLRRNDPDALWPFLVLIIFSGLLFYSSFSAINLEFAASFMSATRRTLMLFCWVFMAAQIYRQHLPVCLFFGAGNLLFSQFPAMVGYLIEISHPRLDSFGASLVNVAATAFMALILVVGIVVVAMRAKGPQGASLRPAEPADAAQRAMDDIARRCALTPREVEIALLIVKGYTLPMIGERLFISTDTVRSHSKKLYKKLGIHKKQELIALVERHG